ncbi:hypothetical protein PQE20_04090 [Vibrio harveyi]|uniref:DUF6680 family protein n=1 Tax=Vibrio harveyi TaxID=669 RepID=UPI00234C293E|nr:DUF6680 family protein [Vibrio harveyi]WCP81184.1 hypothetical protein PQE20_04090 [Vibrio harveyi]
MTISDWIMILAVFSGPIVAVQVTKHLDAKKEKRQRKLDIFKTLMATRSYATSWDHVMTLNRIDLEFEVSHQKEKAVVEAWKQYFDLLGDKTITGEQWGIKRVELLVELLHKMALVLDYDFDKTHIKNSSYSPVAHGNIDNQQAKIREGIIDILEGKRVVPMNIMNLPQQS